MQSWSVIYLSKFNYEIVYYIPPPSIIKHLPNTEGIAMYLG